MKHKPDELHLTLCDDLSGWKYIRETHGDLYGVGWDRVQARLEKQIEESAKRIKALPLDELTTNIYAKTGDVIDLDNGTGEIVE